MWRPADTSLDAWHRQLDAFRAMRPDQRLRLAAEMSHEVRRLAEAGAARRQERVAART